MEFVMLTLVLAAAALLLTLPTLTAVGARRRGRGLVVAVVGGIFFPITWAVWYLHDEQPYRRTAHVSSH